MRKHIARIVSLLMAIALMASLMVTPTFALSTAAYHYVKGEEILKLLPDAPERPARPTTLEQAEGRARETSYIPTNTKWIFDQSKESVIEEIVTLTDSLTAGKTSDTAKVKAIFDWVSQNVTYDDVSAQDFQYKYYDAARDAFGTYLRRSGVCEGYAKLCWFMCSVAEIPSFVFEGIARESGPHGWNAAWADGRWIFFDATWSEWDMGAGYHYSVGTFFGSVGPLQIYWDAGHNSPNQYVLWVCHGYPALTSLSIPHGIASLEEATLGRPSGWSSSTVDACKFPDVTSVTVPETVASIQAGAFWGCTGLTEILVEEGNPNYVSVDGVLYTRDMKTLVAYPVKKAGTFVVPDGVTKIENYAFCDCAGLTAVTLPDSLETIGSSAFHDCTGLTSVMIPDSVTDLQKDAFYRCSGLTSVILPAGISVIHDDTFYKCTSLTSVTIPESVTSVYRRAFQNCFRLETVYYGGTKAQWRVIKIDKYNEPLTRATRYYEGAVPETTPTPKPTPMPTPAPAPMPTPTPTPTPKPVQAQFSDVDANAWYANAVNTVVAMGAMGGYGGGKFGPEDALDLDQVAQVAYNVGNGNYNGALNGNYWAEKALAWAKSDIMSDIITRPLTSANYSVPANREQAAVALYRLAVKLGIVEPQGFTNDLDNAHAIGLINGYGDGNLHGEDTLTRAQYAQMLVNLADIAAQNGKSL